VSEDPNTVYRGPVDGADCERCPFAVEGRPSKPVAGIGPLDPDWIILGEGPGKNETRFGEPFIGASGQLMNRLLGEVGISRKRLWISNATLCEPPDKSPDAQRDEAAACCRPRLINELRRIPGKPILVLGGPATRAVVPSTLTKITELASTYHEVDLDETGPRVVIPSIHPAFILRSAGGGGADKQGGKAAGGGHTATMGYVNLKFDVLKVKNAAAGKTIKLDMRRGVTRQWELEDKKKANQLIADLVREIIAEEFCAIDLETYVDNELRHSALQGFIAKIRFFGLSSKKRAITVLWDQLTPSSINHIRFLLGSKRIVKTFHNMIYEHMVLQNQHYRFRIAGPQEDCYIDSETEFLTECGWLRYDQIKRGTQLATIDQQGRFELQHFFKRVAKKYKGKALVFETLHTRAVVTPNHRMWCRPVRRTQKSWRGAPLGPWQFIRAEDMLCTNTDSFEVQQTCTPREVGRPSVDTDFYRLMGLWIADGSLDFYKGKPNKVLLSQKRGGAASSLLRVLQCSYGFRCSTHVHAEAWRAQPCVEEVWALTHPIIAQQLHDLCGRYSKERHLPHDVWTWPRRAQLALLDGLFLGDGSHGSPGKQKRIVYSTHSPQLAADVQALALLQGWTASCSRPNVEGGFAVCILRKAPRTAQVRARTTGKNASVREIAVDDRIVCFSVPNETLITRSQGRPAFYGNTMLGHHAAFPGNNHRLQSVACQFRGIPPWKSHFKKSKDETKKDAPASAEEEADYNCSDVFATAKTVEPIHFWIKKTGTERVYDIDRKMAACAAKMHLDGYYVDGDVNAELDKRLSKVVEASHEHLLNTFESRKEKVLERLAFERAKTRRLKDPDDFQARVALRLVEEQKLIAKDKWDFSPGKSLHIIALLKAMGVALIAQTKTGKTSTSASVLEDLIHVPEVASILRYRDNNTLLKGPVRRMFEWSLKADKKHWLPPYVQDDGRAHPIWSVNKISGRWGSENPMSQNTSRGDERNKDITRRLPNIRRQFVAPLYRRIVCFDLEQLEARGMAVQSDDPFLCQIFAEGKDIHGEFAKFIFPDFGSLEKGGVEYTAKRDITKRLEYGGLYGGADVTVWKSIVVDFPEITLPMVSAAIKKMKVAVAGVLRWQAALFLRVSKSPYELRDYILGRRRVFPTGNPPPTDVNNNPNQFLGSAIMNIGMATMLPKLDKYRGKVFAILQIHDACYFECPDDDRICNSVARDIRDSWTQTYHSPSGIPITFPVEIKMGYSVHDANKELDEAFGVGRPGLTKVKLVT